MGAGRRPAVDRNGNQVVAHLEDGEGLLASVGGFEQRRGWARRRVTVAATDQRLLLVWRRPGGPVVAVPYADLHRLELDDAPDGVALHVESDQTSTTVCRIGDRSAVSLLCQLVSGRVDRVRAAPREAPRRVRILDR